LVTAKCEKLFAIIEVAIETMEGLIIAGLGSFFANFALTTRNNKKTHQLFIINRLWISNTPNIEEYSRFKSGLCLTIYLLINILPGLKNFYFEEYRFK